MTSEDETRARVQRRIEQNRAALDRSAESERTERTFSPVSPCFRCGAPLAQAFPGELRPSRQPSGAVVFTASGNYGSAVFDPGIRDDVQLVINICDECLTEAADTDRVTVMTVATTRSYLYLPWKGHDPETGEARR